MSVLNAFLSTWSTARATFGEGSPQGGTPFDQSAALHRLSADLEAAAPGGHWSGGGSTAYGNVNGEHQRVITALGGLDRRLAGQIDKSAQIVVAGRRELDFVRTWVVDAAQSVPKNQAGEQMLLPIVAKGLSQVSDIVTRTNGELAAVGGNVSTIAGEYQALGEQTFGGGLPDAPPDPNAGLSEARRRAIDYADQWAGNAGDPHRANPDYENFGDGGGDCTNFASQVMRAGGFDDVGDGIDDWHRGDADDWYYNNGPHFPGNTNSNTWSVAQANRDFVVNSGRGEVVGTSPMPASGALDPLAPSKAGLVPGDLIYYHDEATGTINHTAVYMGQQMQGGQLVDVVNQHALGWNNFHDDWMPDRPGFTGGNSSVEFIHVTYPGE